MSKPSAKRSRRRSFTKEFKAEAAQLVMVGDRTITEVAKDLDLTETALRSWVDGFVHWYNQIHLHSGIRFITPADRHEGRETEILAARDVVYADARRRHPERWSGRTRDWTPIRTVVLNPSRARPRPAPAADRGQCHHIVISSATAGSQELAGRRGRNQAPLS